MPAFHNNNRLYHMFKGLLFSALLLVMALISVYCQEAVPIQNEQESLVSLDQIYSDSREWVDSVYNTLSDDERITQLFWLAVENPESAGYSQLIKQTEKFQPGGILLFRMTSHKALEVIEDLQTVSRIPLLVSVDGEWGLAMRFPDVVPFPFAMTLGAIQDDSLIYKMGFEMARQFRLMGIHVNMAPVADVNSNPNNPVIGHRSFGELPGNVARKSVAYMRGLQDGGVMAVGKHFPGHGDTETDSHKTLPFVDHTRERLDEMDLPPFKELVNAGIWAIMTAHIEVPSLETTKGVPTSFSSSVIKDLLREEMGFRGLVITDAVNMQGAKTMGRPGMVDALALAAGNDIVEFTENLPAAIESVKLLISENRLSWDDIEDKCRRALAFKYWLIEKHPAVTPEPVNILTKLNRPESLKLVQQIYDASLTVLINSGSILPLSSDAYSGYACVILGEAPVIQKSMLTELGLPVYQLPVNDPGTFDLNMGRLQKYEKYIVIIADTRWGRQASNSLRRNRIVNLAQKGGSVAFFMGNCYHLSVWNGLDSAASLVVTYQNNEGAQNSVLRLIKGEIGADGKLPVSVKGMFKASDGLQVEGKSKIE
jgi:beta-N-acetylhexosaminidase